jgi:phage shock protein PspC (stress-responsive transcriptional regulator)
MATKANDSQKREAELSSSNGYRKLCRSDKDKILGGVAGGLGAYFEVDPAIIRLIFVLLTIFGGSGVPIYLVLWLILPKCKNSVGKEETGENIRENMDEMKDRVREFAQEIKVNRPKNQEDSRFWWGVIILVLGFLLLFSNFGLFEFADFGRLWPVVLILIGLAVIL